VIFVIEVTKSVDKEFYSVILIYLIFVIEVT